tara:strand:- start:218 stop:556 length:339 start_codon:yes stop_codon:yes gene_type:complete
LISKASEADLAASKREAFFSAEIEIDPEQGRQNSWMLDLARALGDPNLAQNINYLYEVLHDLCADNPGKLFSFVVRAKPGADLESLLVISDFFRSLDEASPECSVLAYLAYD